MARQKKSESRPPAWHGKKLDVAVIFNSVLILGLGLVSACLGSTRHKTKPSQNAKRSRDAFSHVRMKVKQNKTCFLHFEVRCKTCKTNSITCCTVAVAVGVIMAIISRSRSENLYRIAKAEQRVKISTTFYGSALIQITEHHFIVLLRYVASVWCPFQNQSRSHSGKGSQSYSQLALAGCFKFN